jgi:hypothetical protein
MPSSPSGCGRRHLLYKGVADKGGVGIDLDLDLVPQRRAA